MKRLYPSTNILLLLVVLCAATRLAGCTGTTQNSVPVNQEATAPKSSGRVRVGAETFYERELPGWKGKTVGVVCNHTALLGDTLHLVDALLAGGVDVRRVFAPEHGFRGEAEAGAFVQDGKDPKTGLPVVSLYGKNKKPAPALIEDLDAVIFDVQDVGCRFYTYLSTLTYVMETCAETGTRLVLLDRPNPNGWYADGPVLQPEYKSFVGAHAVPVVHGMTLGEFAKMINGERLLRGGAQCPLQVVRAEGYRHDMRWEATGLPWRAPSPNLPTPLSAEAYPILCWLEGTVASCGRGTDAPFEQAGFPWHESARKHLLYESKIDSVEKLRLGEMRVRAVKFSPRSIPGKAARPKFEGQTCYGFRIDTLPATGKARYIAGLALLKNFYQEQIAHFGQPPRKPFFTPFFEKLAGTGELRKAVVRGRDATEIYESWQTSADQFRRVRARYLLYP